MDNVPGKPGSKRARRRNLVAAEEFGALACRTEFCDAARGHNSKKTISEVGGSIKKLHVNARREKISVKQKNNMTNFNIFTAVFVAASLFLIPAFAQSSSDKGYNHSSIDGGYSVTIPAVASMMGGGPLEDEFTSGLGTSYSTYWRANGLYLQTGYADFDEDERILPLVGRRAKLNGAIQRMPAVGELNYGVKFLGKKPVSTNGNNGIEFMFQTPEGKMIYRLFNTSKNLVRLIASYESSEAEAAALQFLNSLELPPLAQIIARKVEAATPSPLPKCGSNIKKISTLQDEGLKGRIRSITVDTLETRNNQVSRYRSHESYYDELGNYTKEIALDFGGKPDYVTVYGCIDNMVVSRTGSIAYENRFTGLAPGKPGVVPKPRDKRYGTRYENNYDEKSQVKEGIRLGNDGEIFDRALYVYTAGAIEITEFDGDGVIDKKITETLDAKHNLIKRVDTRVGDYKVEYRDFYKYDQFDAKGNWTRRTVISETSRPNEAKNNSTSKEYRTISYYP